MPTCERSPPVPIWCIVKHGADLMVQFKEIHAAHNVAEGEGPTSPSRLTLTTKRTIDIFGSAILLITTLPLLILVSVLVALDGGPILFRHARVGRNGRYFYCLKFRTMMVGAEPCLKEYLEHHPQAKARWQSDHKLDFDPRITPTGQFLRSSSLDELPQLFNILRGDMSLVGPRPITNEELSRYGAAIEHYLAVRPGLTGPWQISGRNEVAYSERVALDRNYVRKLSIIEDILILLRTPSAVFSRRGAK